MQKKLQAFGHPWHLGHQHDLIQATKHFIDWHWLVQYIRPFSDKPRGNFPDVKWVTEYEAGKYDFALLHIDNQCVDEEIYTRGKGRLYRELNEVIKDIPKIVINHGTYFYPEKFTTEELIERTKKIVGDNTMVANSFKAVEQWGFGTAIWHGMGLDEWFDRPKESRVVTMLSPAGLDLYYDRDFLSSVKELLQERYDIDLCHITVDWSANDFDDYRDFLGRSIVYFNPTKESPMPRSRTEAMLSGCCVITTPHQDADKFIVDGVNGFIVKRDPDEVVEKIKWCLDNRELALKIGQNGKKTAQALFNRDRYGKDWLNLLEKVLNTKLQ